MGALFKNMMIKVLLRKPGHDTGMIIHYGVRSTPYYVLVYRSLALGDQWACGPIQSLLQNPALGTPALGDILRHGIWIPPWNLSWTLASSQVQQSMPHLQMRIEVRTAPIRRLLLLWSIISGQCDSITRWPPIPSHPIPVHSNRPLDSLTVWQSLFSHTWRCNKQALPRYIARLLLLTRWYSRECVCSVLWSGWMSGYGPFQPGPATDKGPVRSTSTESNLICPVRIGTSYPASRNPPAFIAFFSQFTIYLLSLLFITARNLLAWDNTAVSSHLSTR